MNTSTRTKLIVVGLLAVLATAVLIFSIFFVSRGSFYITTSNPADGQTVDLEANPSFVMEFNKPIKNLQDKDISISPNIDIRVVVNGNKLTLLPYSEIEEAKTYTIDLKNVIATDGDKLRKQSLSFTVGTNNSGVGTEQFSQRRYPILAVIHYDDHWAIHEPDSEIVIDPPADSKIPFYLYVDTILDDTQQREPANVQQALLEQYRQDALNYIKSKGFNPDDYPIWYTDPTLQAKYNATSGTQTDGSGAAQQREF